MVDGITRVFEYGYDLAGRLETVTRNGTLVVQYTYDSNGNRLSASGEAGLVEGTYDAQDRLLTYGLASYTYRANGELASKTVGTQTTTYDYDTLGNLIQVVKASGQVITYTVDGRGRRVRKAIDGVPVKGWLYADQLRPIAELDGSGAVVSRFVYGSKPNVPEYVIKNGETYRIVSDHIGTPRIVVHATTGVVVQRFDVQPFGELIQDSNPGWLQFGFAGGLYDPDTGLVRFGSRDYDPVTGQWAAKDPILFGGDGPNLYSYVENDPINFVDSTGEGKFGVAIRVGKWGVKQLGNLTRDQAKRILRKERGDIHGTKKQLKKWSKDKGRGKPIREKHGDGTTHWHRPDRPGGHGFENQRLVVFGACLGQQVFGDNLLGNAVNFFNPLSDLQDLIDLFQDEDDE